MDAQFSIRLDRKTMESVFRRVYFRKSHRSFVSIAVLVATLFYLEWSLGNLSYLRSWLMLAALVLLMLASFAFDYAKTMRLAKSNIEKWGDREVVYSVAGDGLQVTTPQGSSLTPWKACDALWIYQDVWLLFIDPTNHFVLPAPGLAGEVGEFVAQKVCENGGKVK